MLQTKQIGKRTVSQAGMIHAVRRVNMVKELQGLVGKYDDETMTALALYPHIAGCVEPKITIEQFMGMTEQELDALTIAVMELNPHWFTLPEDEQEKKTGLIPPESTTDLAQS
jgi:hypothetical protein